MDLDIFMEAHPFAYIAALVGGLVGWYSVKVMSGDGLSVSEVNYQLPLIWKIATPIACAVGGFFVGAKMFE